jgi:Mg2+ and Co2+ transporter CorA
MNTQLSNEVLINQVNDLLSLKQQQASVLQTFESVRQAEETTRQGRAIVVFTIITIIFMPLSFVSSLFGMNNIEFGAQTTLTLRDQFRLMCK